MTVLVIGPTGTVGSQLLPLLAEQRTPVRALVHATGGAAARLPGVEVATGDLTDPSTLVEAMAHFDYWRTGVGAEVTSHLGDLVGRPPRRFAAFAHDHTDAFRGPAPDRPGSAAAPVPPAP